MKFFIIFLTVLVTAAMAADETTSKNETAADTVSKNVTVADTVSKNVTVAETKSKNETVADTNKKNVTAVVTNSKIEKAPVTKSKKETTPSPEDNAVDTGSKGKFFPEAFYRKAHSFMIHANAFKNYSYEQSVEWIDNAEVWTPPRYLSEGFPYYLAGYEEDDRPVWIGEVGKYDVRAVVAMGQQAQDDLERYVFQACLRVLQSFQNVTGKDIRQYILITDWEGLDVSQAAYVPTVRYAIGLAHKYLEVINLALHQMIAINVNYATELVAQLAKPILGSIFERIEIFGNNKAKWMSYLHKLFPPEILPPWYGGSKDFKPIAIYG